MDMSNKSPKLRIPSNPFIGKVIIANHGNKVILFYGDLFHTPLFGLYGKREMRAFLVEKSQHGKVLSEQ